MVSIRCRETQRSAVKKKKFRVSYRNTADLQPVKNIASQNIMETKLPNGNVIAHSVAKQKESKYDRHLRKYQYAKALDCVMLPYIVNKTPHIAVALMQELSRFVLLDMKVIDF